MIPLSQLTKDDEACLQRLADRQSIMVADTCSWSEVNSGSWNPDGLTRMVPLITDRLFDLPVDVRLEHSSGIEVVTPVGNLSYLETSPVITASCRPEAPIQVVFTGHYDTVFGPDAGFDSVTKLDEERLNGPGLADMKGGLIVMMEALSAFESTENSNNVGYRIVYSPDEEIGNPTSADVIMTASRGAHVGLTYEPAMEDGSLAGGRKGSGNFSIVIKGRSAHAGRAHSDGRSAILAAAELVVAVESLNGKHEGVTFNTGKIDGGGPNNQVPDRAVVRLNVRVPDGDARDWALTEIERATSAISARDGISVEVHGGFYRPPKPMNAAQTALLTSVRETGKAIDLDLSWSDTGGVCEGNNVFAAGVPNVDTLGVRGGRIHSSDEFVVVDSFAERASLSALILNRLATGRIDAHHIRKLMAT